MEWDADPGHLSKLGIDESAIPSDSRIPRFTNAIWKYKCGAVGSLSHSVALHGTTYDTELVIICDGHMIKLADLYSDAPTLIVMEDGKAEPSKHYMESASPAAIPHARLSSYNEVRERRSV